MAKLHELLAAEKTPNAAWHEVLTESERILKNPANYFEGYTKSLSMLNESAANEALVDAAREDKPVVTSVPERLEWTLSVWTRAEDLQSQKNATNRRATATVMWAGNPFLEDLPVDELLGLESRLSKIRALFATMPTLDSSRRWERDPNVGDFIWRTVTPEVTTKTERQIEAAILVPATVEHPAQVQAIPKDVPVGRYTTVRFSGAVPPAQKAAALERMDLLLMEIKQARMRANETEVEESAVARQIMALLLEPFEEN